MLVSSLLFNNFFTGIYLTIEAATNQELNVNNNIPKEDELLVDEAEESSNEELSVDKIEDSSNQELSVDKIEDSSNQELTVNETENLSNEEVTLEGSHHLYQTSDDIQKRSKGSGLVQLWQVVPSGQESKEGKSTSEIFNALKCKPNHDLLPSGGKSQHTTYVNSCYVDDALYLGEDSDYFYIYLSGYEGKVAKTKSHYFKLDLNGDGQSVSYEIQAVAYYIPDNKVRSNDAEVVNEVNQLDFTTDYLNKYSTNLEKNTDEQSEWYVQSPSYYSNENGTLYHYLSNNIRSTSYSKSIVGKAPSWMSQGVRYYSYDGIYFYRNWREIEVDGVGAINKNNPFYNYYQFLPFRSVSNYSLNAINKFTTSYGYTTLATKYPAASNESSLVNSGLYFHNVQNKYGINGALQYAMAIHESGWGRSSLSINKNNLFGMNATDSNPYGNGTAFSSVESGINYHADRYLSWGYTDALSDWRYYGSHVGNKGSGMNVCYASDPFWGEKIAGWYYRFDEASGMKDYGYYSIGIKQSNVVEEVKSEATKNSKTYYKTNNGYKGTKISDYPVLLIGESNGYYRIKTDMPIEDGSAKYSAKYNWLTTNGYILKNNIYVSNHNNFIYPYSELLIDWVLLDNNWYYFSDYGVMKIGWLLKDGNWYYLNPSGEMATGWLLKDGNWYYLNPSGEMVTGWLLKNGNWYYLNPSGEMATGWLLNNGNWYYLNPSGEMATGWLLNNGNWYYLNPSGKMATGWLQEGSTWYYLNPSGAMATDTIIDGWQITSSGKAYEL